MSDPITPLNGASFQGFATVRECPRRGMITLRGDLSGPMGDIAAELAETLVPRPGRIASAAGRTLGWMSPDELLLMVPPDEVPGALARIATALAGTHHLAAEVTDARALLRVEGEGAREVMAKLMPVDFAPQAFQPGQLRRSRLAQVPAAVWAEEDGAFGVMCFRSVAAYVFAALSTAAEPGGEVGYF